MRGVSRVSWLPLAADPEIWSDQPTEEKKFHLAFAGNVWDQGRAEALQLLLKIPKLRFGFRGHGAAWKEAGAKLLRESLCGFNINSWFGTEHAFDLNMRFFETLACGVPLLTNRVPVFAELFRGQNPPFVRTYETLAELPSLVEKVLIDQEFLSSGPQAREFILGGHTYVHRASAALKTLGVLV